MGIWERQVLPRLLHVGMKGEDLAKERRKALAGARGVVLELGFGSGLNLRSYPEGVERLLVVEPNAVARGLAQASIQAAPFPVQEVGLDGQSLDLEDASVDAVVSTWTLCTIPDPSRALSETLRVLRPGGSLHFLEHGQAPEEKVLRWQRRLNPIQSRCFGGCRLDRPIDELVRASGLELVDLERFYGKGPRALAASYRGQGRKPQG